MLSVEHIFIKRGGGVSLGGCVEYQLRVTDLQDHDECVGIANDRAVGFSPVVIGRMSDCGLGKVSGTTSLRCREE